MGVNPTFKEIGVMELIDDVKSYIRRCISRQTIQLSEVGVAADFTADFRNEIRSRITYDQVCR
jgi:hypothetical protein